jgi:hypothetical protein
MSSFLFDYNQSSSSTLPSSSTNNNNNNHVTFALDNNNNNNKVIHSSSLQHLKSEIVSIDDLLFQSNNNNSNSAATSTYQLDNSFILPVKQQQEGSIVSIDELFANEAFLASSMIPSATPAITGLPSSLIEKSKHSTNQVLFHNSLPSYYQQPKISSSRPVSFGSTTSSVVSTPSNQQKLIGKRSLSFLSDKDFPPISTTTATTSSSSGKKLQTVNYSTVTTPTPPPSSSEKKRTFSNPSTIAELSSASSSLFQPKTISINEIEKCSCSLVC